MAIGIPGMAAVAPLPPMPSAPMAPTVGGASSASGTGAAAELSGGGLDFASSLTNAIEQLNTVNQNADSLATQAAAGTLKNPHEYILAANEASMTTQVAVAVRNKALEAFNEIMRMPL